ncbi:MAG: copper amine oxidase N-terminal domain-containing protein [Caldisericota bacterium]|nr:copper amine oxidase N-terminal domain-containing protein [Caldisericota bacterium]
MFRKLIVVFIILTLSLWLVWNSFYLKDYSFNGIDLEEAKASSSRIVNYWVKVFRGEGNDEAYAVTQTSDENYVIVGRSNSFGLENPDLGDYDMVLIKLSPEGSIIWSKLFGGTKFDEVYAIQETFDKGLLLLGSTKSFNVGLKNAFIIKLDEDMEIQWAKTLGSNKINAFEQTSDKGFILAGSSTFSTLGGSDAILIKIDKEGRVKWSKVYGGSQNEEIRSVHQTIDGGFIMSGSTNSFSFGGSDFFIAKLDQAGSTEWARVFGGSSNDVSISSFRTSDAGYLVGGYTYSFGIGNVDALLMKLDSNGNPIWIKVFGQENYDMPRSIIPVSSGGFVVTGGRKRPDSNDLDIYVSKFNQDGNAQWTNIFNGSSDEEALSITQTTDDDLVVVGWTKSFGSGDLDFIVLRMDPDGDVEYCGDYIKKQTVESKSEIVNGKIISLSFEDVVSKIFSKARNVASSTIYIEVKDICPVFYAISASSGYGGKIIPSGKIEVINGEERTFIIKADEGFKISAILIDGNSIAITSDLEQHYTFTNVQKDHTITAEFEEVIEKKITIIILQPDNPMMTVNGNLQEIDLGRGTKPVIIPEWGRTVVPIRAIVEALHGTIEWDGVERKVTIRFKDITIELWIDNPQAKVNGIGKWIDESNHNVRPIIVNDRTMLPLRFIAESLGCEVEWDPNTRIITITHQE